MGAVGEGWGDASGGQEGATAPSWTTPNGAAANGPSIN